MLESFEVEQVNVIDRFNERYKFLSNFYPSTIFFEGKKYKTIEHAYQSAKALNEEEKEKIRNAIAPSQAKKFGRLCEVRHDWDDVKADLMLQLLRLKFQNPFLRHLLKQTKNIPLIEGNSWHDNFWGTCRCKKCNRNDGQNMLGKLLMTVRDEINKEEIEDEVL